MSLGAVRKLDAERLGAGEQLVERPVGDAALVEGEHRLAALV